MSDLTFTYTDTAGVDSTELQKTAKSLAGYHTHLADLKEQGNYPEPASAINTPFDTAHYEEVIEVCEKLSSEKLRYVFVVGIGGSSLGTKAVYDAVCGAYDAHTGRTPKLIFVDTLDTALMREMRTLVSSVSHPESVAVCVVTKSGTTTETLANFETLYALLTQELGDISHRIAAISDANSPFLTESTERGFHTLGIPEAIAGRYSVFTAVGLLPLMLSGVDVSGLLRGARKMIDRCLTKEGEENPAQTLAALWHEHAQNNTTISNTFFFNPNLASLGGWQKQLMAESLGKTHDTEGNEVHTGILPLTSIGSTDLHSIVQLYLSGSHAIFTTFVKAPPLRDHVSVPQEDLVFPERNTEAHGKTFVDIMEAVEAGVEATYRNHALPYACIELSETSAHTTGAYMALHMIAVMDAASLWHVNAFDQPAVEGYKAETHTRLTQ